MGDNARMRLKELCDRMCYTMTYHIGGPTGPGHSPTFSGDVTVKDKNNNVIMVGHGSAKRLRDAQEAACRGAMDWRDMLVDGTPTVRAESVGIPSEALYSERSYAWLGDAGAEFLLAMLAYRAGISPATTDSIRQKCFTNERLAETSQNQLTSVAATATAAEAKVGWELSTVIDTILPVIEEAIKIGNPQLVADIHAEVHTS